MNELDQYEQARLKAVAANKGGPVDNNRGAILNESKRAKFAMKKAIAESKKSLQNSWLTGKIGGVV